ncbi:hypothetical protein L6452_10347 [Arctium lappa]|uniref:Uncharacterized protein n=1 Tax=Arctium lappa TaxID=4217 RepID=A0ACB9DM44_ARCLA|nr:hypothetical protein L6452_10347 [Arctium lappa]
MAQHVSGEQYVKEGHHSTDEYAHNPLQSATGGHQIGTNVQTGAAGHEQAGKHDGGILHRSGSGSSSSSEDDGEGGRRKKKGVVEKIKEKVPCGNDHGGADHEQNVSTTAVGGGGYEAAGHEKKGMMEKIKEKLPGGHH